MQKNDNISTFIAYVFIGAICVIVLLVLALIAKQLLEALGA